MRSSANWRTAALSLVVLLPAAPAVPQSNASSKATVTAVRRESLPEVVRVTVELDREVAFHDERIDGPPRVFLDLTNAMAAPALRDRSFSFGGDVVRHVRLGRPAPSLTRVVLDLDGAARYSVYPLYQPFRLVIDVERAATIPAPPATRVAPGLRIAAVPAPLPARPAFPVRELTRGVTGPRPTPGASWQPDLLPARAIAVAVASSTQVARQPASIAARVGPPPVSPAANANGGYSLSRQLGLGISRVVIDPGHGGHDPGAQVKGLNEADLVLDIAVRLEKLLKAQPGVEVMLTRRTNVYIPLEERTAIANRDGADLFLSIHANASENSKARGLETYYLNFAPNPEAERIAARENAGSARTMHALPDIVKAIALNNKIDESRDFAGQVQTSLVDRLRRSNRNTRDLGVKQAPFMVLIGATMPSVLAEVSFITNDDEGPLLKTVEYRQHIADALLQGILRYQRGLKSTQRLAAQ